MVFRRQRQSGVALIMVVVTVAIISLLAVAMITEQAFMVRRVQNAITLDSALQYGIGGEQMAALALKWDADNTEADGYSERWNTPQHYPVDNGMIRGHLSSQQGRFNLNNLVNAEGKVQPNAQAALERLLDQLQLDKQWIPALVDWVDPDANVSPGGAEDSAYQTRERPYLAANQPLVSRQDLRLVQGVTPELYEQLEAYVTALPSGTPLNVNFASPEVLAAYIPELSPGEAGDLTEALRETMAEDESDFKQRLSGVDWEAVPAWGVDSEYFTLDVTVSLGGSDVQLYSVLKRNGAGDVSVVHRGRGLQ
ncbi:MAG: type II secretion system minor pseudopilin GspK [Pseudomonadota bacterium]